MEKARYVLDKDIFRRNVDALRKVFETECGIWTILGFSVKTCPDPTVIREARIKSMMAEVVSPYELALATGCGFSLNEIIYNGVIPDPEAKFRVALLGGIVNLENYTEFEQVEAEARKNGRSVKVGIRLNIDTGNGRKSRFGVEPWSNEFKEIVTLNSTSRYIRIAGVHVHAFRDAGTEHYQTMVKETVKIARQLDAEYIDLGSRMYGAMDERLERQFESRIPAQSEYARAAREEMGKAKGWKPKVIVLEPGTPVIANAVSLEAEVMNIRKVRGQGIATLNCSTYDMGFLVKKYKVPMDIERSGEGGRYTNLRIYGNTCTEDDIICESCNEDLAVGDRITFRNMGAYTLSLASRFCTEPLELVSR